VIPSSVTNETRYCLANFDLRISGRRSLRRRLDLLTTVAGMTFDTDGHGAGIVAVDLHYAQVATVSAAPSQEEIGTEIFDGFYEMHGVVSSTGTILNYIVSRYN
jgi:hypothetical protein